MQRIFPPKQTSGIVGFRGSAETGYLLPQYDELVRDLIAAIAVEYQ
jgi:hypothetical protein